MPSLRAVPGHLIGPRALLVHGDPLVLDRWRWVSRRLPRHAARLVDAGCGNGWLAMNAARLGHHSLGLGLNDHDLSRAKERAAAFGLDVDFQVQDLRRLIERRDLWDAFDVVTCTETIEHLLDDAALLRALAHLLREDGRLLLTTPNVAYRPIDRHDAGPFRPVEDGGHVRKGYDSSRLADLCHQAGLEVVEVSSCSGWASQKATRIFRLALEAMPYTVAWLATFPLRALGPLLDPVVRRRRPWPDYSICVVARRSGAPATPA